MGGGVRDKASVMALSPYIAMIHPMRVSIIYVTCSQHHPHNKKSQVK